MKMTLIRGVITTGMLLLAFNAWGQNILFTGMLRSFNSLLFDDAVVNEQTLDLTLSGRGSFTAFAVNGYVHAGFESKPETGIREAYIDLYLPSSSFRIGKQAIVWGHAEVVFLTDIVTPQNLRNFILADFNEIRFGIPAITYEYAAGALRMELVWLPRAVPNMLPESGSIWHVDEMTILSTAEIPDDSFNNSEVFGRISYFGAGLNAQIMGGYTWYDMAIISAGSPVDIQNGTLENITSSYARMGIIGASFNAGIGNIVLRGETALYLNRDFTLVEAGMPPQFNVSEHHQFHGLIGVDWKIFKINMSAQYINANILNYTDALLEPKGGNVVTFRMNKKFFSQTLTLATLGYFGLDHADIRIHASAAYTIEDGVELKLGMEIFSGDTDRRFGKYSDNSLVYASARWYF